MSNNENGNNAKKRSSALFRHSNSQLNSKNTETVVEVTEDTETSENEKTMKTKSTLPKGFQRQNSFIHKSTAKALKNIFMDKRDFTVGQESLYDAKMLYNELIDTALKLYVEVFHPDYVEWKDEKRVLSITKFNTLLMSFVSRKKKSRV